MKRLILAAWLGIISCPAATHAKGPAPDKDGWHPLFDGKTLDGWKAADEPKAFKVENGLIVAGGTKLTHLYYVGPILDAKFKNFELKAEVKTRPKGNSGIIFHTEFQAKGFPDKGFEFQINNTGSDKVFRTGSIYPAKPMNRIVVKDDEWFECHLLVKGNKVVLKVNGEITMDTTLPNEEKTGRTLGSGTFAIQGHDPGSIVYFRSIRVKPHALLVAVAPWAAAGEKNAEQDKAIAAIKQMKGFVEFDKDRPGKPVTKIHLFGGKTAGIGLAPLAKLPETEWIGLHLSDITEADLDHLKGLTKLRRLGLANIKLSDEGLKRLEGMTALEILFLMENPITDAGLDHLRKLTKLKQLGLGQTKITDAGLEKLKVFKDLQILDIQQLRITTAGLEHVKSLTKLENLYLYGCNQVRDLQPLSGLPLTSLNLAYCNQLQTVTPLAKMPLTSLNLSGCGKLQDLTPLAGMPLTSLDLGGTQVADLSTLRGMKLTTLNCIRTPVADLAPLAGMPLTSVYLLDCPKLHDLAPLTRMNLTEISLTPKNFTKDTLEVLRQCKSLKTVVVGQKGPDRLAALDFWKKFDAGEFRP